MTPPPTPETPKRKLGCWFYGLIGFLATALIFGAGILTAIWWLRRDIKPVELTLNEEQRIQQKVEQLENPQRYEAGGKQITFTEHELNGLLHKHTDLGERLKFQIDQDALSAYLAYPMPADSPILPGKTLKGRARLELIFDPENPRLTVKDVTLYGISLPNAWIGGIKDQNLARELFRGNASPLLEGIETLKLENGKVEVTLKD